jgi:hypothetical protein
MYYSGGHRYPIIEIDRVSHRKNPIYESVYVGRPWTELDLLQAMTTSALIFIQLNKMFPEVVAVTALYTHGLVVIVSTGVRYGGFGKSVGMGVLTTPHGLGYAKFVIAVDADIDPFNLNQVMWAISVRANPAGDVVIIPNLADTTPRHHHAPIELHGCTLAWEGDELRIHDASQAVAHEAWTIAQVFGLEEKQVRLTSPFVGGGFGSKLLWQHQILAAAAAKLADRPVRIMLSREGVFRIVGGRTVTEQRVALGAPGGWPAGRPDSHRRRRHDPSQRHAGDLAGEKRLRVKDFLLGCRDSEDEHGRQHIHACTARGGRHVRPRIRNG